MSYAAQALGFNRLLAALPPDGGEVLASIARLEHPVQGQTLIHRSDPSGSLWFPHAGVVALTASDVGGRSVQTSLVGSEGCVGLEALFHPGALLPDAVVQIQGPMSVIPATRLRAIMWEQPAIQTALFRFLYVLSAQALQTVACNRLHSLKSRCCRWLLAVQDRVESDDLQVTQEALATLLGGGRPRINGVLGTIERLGLIRRFRGRIRVINRAGLEAHTCACYGLLRGHFDTFSPVPA